MSTPATIPVFGPDGQVHAIPQEQYADAIKAGGVPAVKMADPTGTPRYIPRDKIPDAVKGGGKLLQDPSQVQTQFEQKRDSANQPGLIHSAVSEIGALVKGAGGMSVSGPEAVGQLSDTAGKIGADDFNRRMDNRAPAYRGVAAAGTLVGVNAAKMEDQADVGNARGILGTAIGDAAPVVAGEALRIPKVQEAIGSAAAPLKGMVDFEAKQAATMRKVVPEAANLPDKAIAGAEDIFRASAPTGMNKGFRQNVYAAAGDLADIARKVDIAESKGGIVNPDLRVRSTVGAIREHLQEMYQNERAPQVEAAADKTMKVYSSEDAANGLDFMSRTAGAEQLKAIAQKAFDGNRLTVAEADKLAIAVNQELKAFERMTSEQKVQARMTNSKIGGLKALDTELGRNLNDTLMQNGQPGLYDYERRFAALSAVRDQLESRMNSVELDTPGVVKGVIRPVAHAISSARGGIASASQAAVADVNIGKSIQVGLGKLKESGISAEGRVVPGPRPSEPLQLPSGAIATPPPPDPSGFVSTADRPAYSPTTRAERLNLLLPEKSGAPIITTPPVEMTPGELTSAMKHGVRNFTPQLTLPERAQPIQLRAPGQSAFETVLERQGLERDPKTGRISRKPRQ